MWWNLHILRRNFGERRILIRPFGLLADDPELMHPRSQGTLVDAQDLRGPVLSLDAPSGFQEVLSEPVAFWFLLRLNHADYPFVSIARVYFPSRASAV